MLDRENIRFNALRNALYHTGRRRSFERLNRWFNFAVILVGAAGVSEIFGKVHGALGDNGPVIYGIMVAAIGAAQLAFDFGGNARDHQSLQRDYYNLLADIEETVEPSEQQLAAWNGRLTRIASDEPPIMRAIDAKAYNDAIDAMELDRGQLLHLPIYHRVLGRFFSYDGFTFRKRIELPNYKPES